MITTRLRDAGWRVSKNTVADSMRRQHLVARPKKRRRGLTRADRRARKPADLLKRDFAPPEQVNQRWTSDLTEIDTDEGVLYLATILDLHSRRALGYALGVHHDAELAAAAVQVAIAVRGGDVAGVVLHTDQGGEFSGGDLVRVCQAAGITQSMGRTGSALDNAVSESFHSTLEFELRSGQHFATRPRAGGAVLAWVTEYNTDRLHTTNGMIAPVDYENGQRRAGAKTYDQLRRRRPRTAGTSKTKAEAATPPQTLDEPLRDGHQPRAVSGPVPPASRAADAVAEATALRAALDPGASTGPGRQHQGQATACPRTRARQPEQDP
jgi:transposase InsO family protein